MPRSRPLSPNIQIYRPQLTSVLSIANRLTGVGLALAACALVAWLVAAALGEGPFNIVQGAFVSWPGQALLFALTFVFFLHFCGGIRHLIWDTVHGFELASIYASGWAVVLASLVLTAAVWLAASLMGA